MILAADALDLPTAEPTAAELAAANMLEAEIEAEVRKTMAFNGIDFKTDVTDAKVIAIVNQRLKAAGWNAQWQMLVEQNKFTKGQSLVGFGLNAAPNDESYATHRKRRAQ